MTRSIPDHGTFKSKYTEIFNRGFRRGANERAAFGLQVSADLKPPFRIPQPGAPLKGMELGAWEKGFEMGFRVGASDAELASVDIPGAHGLISGFSEEILEQFGFFAAEQT
jgi:hypothetical protein